MMLRAVPGRAGVNGLTGRRAERDALDNVVEAVRAGRSPVLVVRGDPGVGKTVLLEYLAERASGSGCGLARAAGVQSEMELVFAGLHQLCRPMLRRGGQPLGEQERQAVKQQFRRDRVRGPGQVPDGPADLRRVAGPNSPRRGVQLRLAASPGSSGSRRRAALSSS